MKVIAKKINNPNCDYLTEGKEYEAIVCDHKKTIMMILDDNKNRIHCSVKRCKHIKGNWTIITDKAKVR